MVKTADIGDTPHFHRIADRQMQKHPFSSGDPKTKKILNQTSEEQTHNKLTGSGLFVVSSGVVGNVGCAVITVGVEVLGNIGGFGGGVQAFKVVISIDSVTVLLPLSI